MARDFKHAIETNAKELTRLHERIHDTLRFREQSPQKRSEWERACAEFHSRYNELAFPGGYKGVLERILAGDEDSIEAALCFLECRPFFFRSGYMFKDLLRKAKRASLSQNQAKRLDAVNERLAEWKQERRKKKAVS